MPTVLPVVAGDRLVGSSILVGGHKHRLLFSTVLHALGGSSQIRVAIPPHGGDLNIPQVYPPSAEMRVWEMSVVATDPFADVVILSTPPHESHPTPIVRIADRPFGLAVGADAVVLGYPFAPIGSVLETWTSCTVTAHAKRQLVPGLLLDELVLSAVSHPGSSGSAVVGKADGVLHGIVRGALAPPELLKIGEIPVATDTSVTLATSAHIVHDLLMFAKAQIDTLP